MTIKIELLTGELLSDGTSRAHLCNMCRFASSVTDLYRPLTLCRLTQLTFCFCVESQYVLRCL